jgi:hypothetical protein
VKYGRLTVLGVAPHVGERPALLCQCDCGVFLSVQRKRLQSGHTQSCGCLQRQRAKENVKLGHDLNRTHAASDTKEHRAWTAMRSRVTYANPNSKQYYVDKGITVHPSWMTDFPAFLAHIGPAPSDDHSVDRIDSNGNYEPGNVKWSTSIEQNRNKSDNVIVSWRGADRLLVELAEEYSIPYQTLHYRIQRAKWPVERSLLTPVKRAIHEKGHAQ